ncbi:MAG: ATP-binding protein [Acidobacteria bacterium]|nr:ATP-binding protein [Acidobacteriota bacterium]
MRSLEQRFILKVPSSTRNLVMIREFVNRVAEQAWLSETERGQLELAVDEACSNVIEHAYGHDVQKEVTVRATFDDDAVRIAVVDQGAGFDPEAVDQEALETLIEQRKTGGLGMRLIRSLMDEVHYEIEPGRKNELTMVKRRQPPGVGPERGSGSDPES